MTRDIEESPGVISLMRKSVKKVINVGIVMIACSIGMAGYSLYKNEGYELVPFYTLLVSTGAGMITGALVSKAWQAQAESKIAE